MDLSNDVIYNLCIDIMATSRFMLSEDLSYVGYRRLLFPLGYAAFWLKRIGAHEARECNIMMGLLTSARGVAIAKDIEKGVSHRYMTFSNT